MRNPPGKRLVITHLMKIFSSHDLFQKIPSHVAISLFKIDFFRRPLSFLSWQEVAAHAGNLLVKKTVNGLLMFSTEHLIMKILITVLLDNMNYWVENYKHELRNHSIISIGASMTLDFPVIAEYMATSDLLSELNKESFKLTIIVQQLEDASGDVSGLAPEFGCILIWVGVSILQALFVKEHNAVCDAIKDEHPNLSDEELYRYARLVTSVVIAKVHTVDWTVELLKTKTMRAGMRANCIDIGELVGLKGEERLSKIGFEKKILSMGYQACGALELWNYPSFFRDLIPQNLDRTNRSDRIDLAALEGKVCHICSSPLFNLDLDTLRYVSYIPNHCLLLYEAVTYAIHNAVLAGGLWGFPQKGSTLEFLRRGHKHMIETSRVTIIEFLCCRMLHGGNRTLIRRLRLPEKLEVLHLLAECFSDLELGMKIPPMSVHVL
ncbi:hypothetical protein ACJX0J_007768, partial [Zea mays]